MIIMLVLAFFIIRNKPEEFGLLPDNDPASVEAVKALEQEINWTEIMKILETKQKESLNFLSKHLA